MVRSPIATLLSLLFLISTSSLAQNPAPSDPSPDGAVQADDSSRAEPVRDPAAIALLQKAIATLGGQAVASQVTDSVTTGTIDPPPGSKAETRTFVWKVAGEEFRREFQGSAGSEVFVSGHGKPEGDRAGKGRRVMQHVAQASPPLHLPALVLLQQLANNDYSLTVVGNATVQGQPTTVVKSVLQSDVVTRAVTPQRWFLDPQTGLPLRVEYRLPDNENALHTTDASVEFGDYRSIQGTMVPFRMLVTQSGSGPWTVTVLSVAFNTNISPTEFDAVKEGDQ